MDFARPVQAVIPGAVGRILAVLTETSAELNVRSINRLSGVSLAHTSRVLPTLVDLGIIERREAPPSALFRFVPENVASRVITALTRARQTVLDEMGRAAAALDSPPTSVIVFGSFARSEADGSSDIDIVIVRPIGLDEDDAAWRTGIDDWQQGVRRLAGNPVEVLEADEPEVRRSFRSRKALWADIRRDGIVVFGSSIATLMERHDV